MENKNVKLLYIIGGFFLGILLYTFVLRPLLFNTVKNNVEWGTEQTQKVTLTEEEKENIKKFYEKLEAEKKLQTEENIKIEQKLREENKKLVEAVVAESGISEDMTIDELERIHTYLGSEPFKKVFDKPQVENAVKEVSIKERTALGGNGLYNVEVSFRVDKFLFPNYFPHVTDGKVKVYLMDKVGNKTYVEDFDRTLRIQALWEDYDKGFSNEKPTEELGDAIRQAFTVSYDKLGSTVYLGFSSTNKKAIEDLLKDKIKIGFETVTEDGISTFVEKNFKFDISININIK